MHVLPRQRMRSPVATALIAAGLAFGWAAAPYAGPEPVLAATVPPGFQDTAALSGLDLPTAVRFALDGRVFVTEKAGIIKVYDSLADTSPTIFADLRTQVHDQTDRGLLGLALAPTFPADPYVYVTYARDAPLGGTAPTYNDLCPDADSGCVASGRLSRFRATGNVAGAEEVLIEDWCHQFATHSIDDLRFGPDGALYLSAGEGASAGFADYGQRGNACGDPPSPSGTNLAPPGAQGGALRAQDLRTAGDPVTLAGTIIRVDPATGAARADNPLFSNADANARRVIAHGLRNPFRFTFRPGTSELWIGDVGWGTAEELNLIESPTGPVRNFGWPCYEGFDAQSGYNGADLTVCEDLYSSGTATAPYAAYGDRSPVAGESCPTGSAAISGLAFYTSGTYPSQYSGSLFFADYARNCIWVVRPGGDGRPDWSTRAPFIQGAQTPVDLEIGPNGDLFYVDLVGGAIRRVTYVASTSPPTAQIVASPASGAVPLTVQFDGTTSTDPDGDPLSYSWDLNGDGAFGDSTDSRPSHTYAAAGNYTVSLRVSDGRGGTGTAATVIRAGNSPPVPNIATPGSSLRWTVGDAIAFSGSATDAEDGNLPPSRLNWQLLLHHCPQTCHVHTVSTFAGTATGSFVAQDHEYPSWLELILSATDGTGATASTSVRLDPQTVMLQFESSPSGLQMSVGTSTMATPFSIEVIVGSHQSISASGPQTLGTDDYVFESWSDGGPPTKDIVAPSADRTFTALYGLVDDSGFTDVSGSMFHADITWLVAKGLTVGCAPYQFCPNAPVTRAQMASFLVRALGLTAGATPDRFNDIGASAHREDINRLWTAGLTVGCGAGRFCPDSLVSRAQMASFLVRALELTAGASPDRFGDIASSISRLDINRLAAAGLTSGCAVNRFCPADPVTRGQMAAFLHRAFVDRLGE